jgi:hypothetical protein
MDIQAKEGRHEKRHAGKRLIVVLETEECVGRKATS